MVQNTSDAVIESRLSVAGMTCGNCVKHVKEAVTNLPGISDVNVDLSSGLVTVRHNANAASVAAIVEAIEDQGYTAKET